MSNIPGATNALPGVFTDTVVQSRGASIPGGYRTAAIIGEGSTDETIVSSANGGGTDGLNSSYTSSTGADGRHFRLTYYPIISNRTTLFKNGTPLVGIEETIDSSTFSDLYDYRIDITTGKIELQLAHLVDQGGAYYVPLSTNVGDGYLSSLELVDENAPAETWTIRCVSVQRDAYNEPITGTARFIAIGSISGSKLDAYGNPVIWTDNGTAVSNGILRFAIWERKVGGVPVSVFREGDGFTVIVYSGVLNKGDSLTANYIVTANLNDPVLLQDMDSVVKRHGTPSTDNNLSLGAQLAFANSAPSIMSLQAAPAMPRRTSYVLTEAMNTTIEDDNDYIFPLPIGVVPAFYSDIHFFTTNNSTGVETQILPNKLDFYLLDTAGYPTTHEFIDSDVVAPAGWSYFYTVKQGYETMNTGFDGYIARDMSTNYKGVFSSSVEFGQRHVGKKLVIIDANNNANIGDYTITSVSDGKLYVSRRYASPYFPDFTAESSVTFDVIDVTTGLPVTGGSAADGYIVPGVGTATATFGSLTIDFSALPGTITSHRLQISLSSEENDGLYDIVSYTAGANTLTIQKAVVDERNMRYEVIDASETSYYIVINKNVVANGYGLRVTIVDDRDATFYDAGWLNALESLETVECDIVVPLPKQTISVIFQNTLAHCKYMSNIKNKKERVLFCGAISGLDPENLTGAEDVAVEDIGVLEGIQGDTVTEVLNGNVEDLANYSVATAFGSTYRCVYFYPDQIVVQAGTDNVLIDGFYIAAAAAGYEAADLRIENPLTNKVLSGFTILRNKQLSPLVLEQLAAAGVTVLQPVSGGGRVVWGITTSQSGYPEEQEISIVFIRDRICKILRSAFSGFIGQPESDILIASLTATAVSTLNSLVSQGLITQYRDLKITRDSVDPRQWNISVRVRPTYPVDFIYIKVELGQL